MPNLTISIGESKRSTHWISKEVTWEQLCKKLSTPKITDETVAEYAQMSKDQRGEIKDVGGYVGGRIEGGNRKAGAITDRQLICLDADYGDLGLWDAWDLFVGKACLMHTSHSHTPEQPRLRFVIPLSRAVSAAEYEPIARRIADWLGINAFDDTTYEASRLMFWSSKPKDGEFICKTYDGDWINPDEVLATYDNWQDMRSWPTSDRQTQAIVRMGKVQGDPLTKPGVIGAFNRAYRITEAMETFLPGVYVPAQDGRWTYAKGSSTGGAVIYDDNTFIYSHHDTDPISKRLCNAFDMVRIHLYGDQDEGSEEDIGNLPSVQRMKELCQNDEKVLKELANGVIQTPEAVFEKRADLERFSGDFSELGLSGRFYDEQGYGILHNKSLGWMFWDGVKWLPDADAEVDMLINQFSDRLYKAARIKVESAPDKASKALAIAELKAATKMRDHKRLKNIADRLKSIVNEPRVESFDADPWALNTPDGIVDLRTGDIRQHDPKERCTKCTTVSPGGAGAEKWYGFIDHVTGGDRDFADYLQTLIGMAAIGTVYEEGLVISYGPGGNGKSTLYGVIKKVLGDYAVTINPDVIAPARGTHPDQFFVAELRGARLVLMGETEETAAMSSAQMKRITSQDEISARRMRQSPFNFTPTHTVIMHTNYLPRLESLDIGTKRRIAVAPFPATLPPNRIITDYKGELYRDCGPAILRWIVDGAVRFYRNGCKLEKPAKVIEATQNYLANEDWMQAFLDECCEVGEGLSVQSQKLLSTYTFWASQNNYRPKRSRDFMAILESRGFKKRATKKCNEWEGLDVKDEMV